MDCVPSVADVATLGILNNPAPHSVIHHDCLLLTDTLIPNDNVMNMKPNQCLFENGATRPSEGVHHSTMKRRNRQNDSGWYRKQYLLLSLPINTRYEFLLFASIDLES